jgi:hypothetical protein
VGMEGYIEQLFGGFPRGIGIAMIVFLAILLIIWLLLPLWVLFIQWNTGKIKDQLATLIELLEKKTSDEKEEDVPEPKE